METDPNHVAAHSAEWTNSEDYDLAWLRPGTPLELGGVYFDLAAPVAAPFVALPGQVAGSGNRYVARRDVTAVCWNRLVEGAVPDGQGTS